MSEEPPEFLTAEQVKVNVPKLPTGAQLVLVAGRIYKREDGKWRRLDNEPTGVGA